MALTDRDIQELREQLRHKMQQAGTLHRLPSEGRSDRRERAAKDKPWFLRFYCPHYFPYEFTDRHIQSLSRCDLLNQMYFLMAFRSWGKSAIGTFGDPLHKIYQQTRNFLLIASINEDVATLFTMAIKMEIEENPRLRQDYGNLIGSSEWGEAEFTTRNSRKVLARGYRSKYRGLRFGPHRPDDVTIDDWEDDDTAVNPDQCRKRMERIWKAIRPAMRRQKDGGYSMKYIGTPITTDSVTWQLWNDDTRNIVKDRIPIIDDTGHPTWPEVYDTTEVDAIRLDSGLHAWHSEYLLNPIPSEEAMFRPEWIQYAERLPDFTPDDVTMGAIDTSGTVRGDFKASVVLTGKRSTMDMYVRHAFIRRCSPQELWSAVHAQQQEFGCQHVIETNAIKDYLHESRELYERDHGCHLHLIPIDHTLAKKEHVLPLQSPMERLKFWFLKNHSDQGRLIEQILVFPNGKNDEGPDTLGEAYRQVMQRVKGIGAKHLRPGRARESAIEDLTYLDMEGWI